MQAMQLQRIAAIETDSEPLSLVDIEKPKPGPEDLLLQVLACGVCHTELDEIEGRTPPPQLPVIPGHEVIGRVVETGSSVTEHAIGDRVGVGWIFCSSGTADENLSPLFRGTGRDANGGYAEYMTVPARYAYPIPDIYSDTEAAPLLCAGAVGYRSLKLADISDGAAVGLMGFGGSAHIVIQLVRHLYPAAEVHVFARDAESRRFAKDLGAVWVGDTHDQAPRQLSAIIDTTPAWGPVVAALGNLAPGGRLVVNAICKEEDDKDALLDLVYRDHLWMERELKSVANVTAADLSEFLPIAAEIPIRPTVTVFRLEDANEALRELKHSQVRGAKVLVPAHGEAQNQLEPN
jgi:propanol-preferring alcohol dehydrogenase